MPDQPINAEIVALITSHLAQMEQRLMTAIQKSQAQNCFESKANCLKQRKL
jgi:hypothetical protein